MELSPLGIWTAQFDFAPASLIRETVAELEGLGYGAIWFGENIGREPISQAGLVLSSTRTIVVATGIMNIWARDPLATVAAQQTLSEAYPDRFLLGLGVSHSRLSKQRQGLDYTRPLLAMREYLRAMDGTAERYRAIKPKRTARVLAALGPKMLALAAEQSDGAHPYFVPPEHTAQARQILGPDKLLAVEQAVVLENDPDKARAIARTHIRRYLPLANYTNNLRRFGFNDRDFEHEGSNRLVDAIVAWGDIEDVYQRVHQHWNAGADHVCLNVVSEEFRNLPIEVWRELAGIAPAL